MEVNSFYFLVLGGPDVVVFLVPVDGVFVDVALEARFSLLPLTPVLLVPDADVLDARLSLLPRSPVLLCPVFDSTGELFPALPTGIRDEPGGLVGDLIDDVSDDASDPSWEPIDDWLSVLFGRPVFGSFKLLALPAFLIPEAGGFDFKLVPLLDLAMPGERSSPDFSRRIPGNSKCVPVGFLALDPIGGLPAVRSEPDECSLDMEGLATSDPSRDRAGRLALNVVMLCLEPDMRSCSRSSMFVFPSAVVKCNGKN